MNSMKGHVIRWMLIISMGVFMFFSIYSFPPWSEESTIKESLHALNLPGNVQAVDTIQAGRLHSVIFWDEEHQMYHHSWMSRSLGMLWLPQGGGFGNTFNEENWKIRFAEGYSSRSNRSYHYIIGEVNDLRVATVEVLWSDGTKEIMEPVIGRIIHFAREGKAGESSRVSVGLNAYGSDREILYTLDHNKSFIPAESQAHSLDSYFLRLEEATLSADERYASVTTPIVIGGGQAGLASFTIRIALI